MSATGLMLRNAYETAPIGRRVTNLLHIADQLGLGGHVVVWLIVARLALGVLLAILGLLDAALDLRDKWAERSR